MKTFTQDEAVDAISLLNMTEMDAEKITVPLQEMFDNFISFISLTDFEQ